MESSASRKTTLGDSLQLGGTLAVLVETSAISESAFATFAKVVPFPIFVLDPDDPEVSFRILFASPAVERTHGYRPEELVGQSLLDMHVPPITAAAVADRLQSILAGKLTRFPSSHRRKDGTQINVDVTACLITWQGRRAVLGVDVDLTPYQEVHRLTEEVWRAAIEGAGEGVWEWNPCTGSVQTSPRCREILDYRENEVRDQFADWIALIHPEDVSVVSTELQAHFTGQKPSFSLEYRLRGKSGKWRWMWSRGRVVERDDSGSPTRVIGLLSDITSRREEEAAHQRLLLRHHLAFIGSGFGVWEYDIETDCSNWDDRMRQIHGATEETGPIGREAWLNHIDARDRNKAHFCFTELMAGREVAEFTLKIRRFSDGAPRHVQVFGNMERDHRGRPVKLLGLCRDVTEATETEEHLRLLEAAMANLSDLVLITKPDPIDAPGPFIVYANPALREFTGYSEDEIIGRSPRLFQGPGTDRATLAEIRDALRAAQPIHRELLNYRKDRTPYWVDLHITPIRNHAGELTHFLSVQRDVTERRKAQIALRESEERYRLVVETQNELICKWLPDTTLTFVNVAYARHFGSTTSALVGTKFIQFIPEDERPKLFELIRHLLSEGEVESYVHESIRADGEHRWHLWKDTPIKDQYGNVVEFLSTGIDITDRRRAELEKENLQKQVVHAQRLESIGRLAGGIAHDFNNMLGAILGHAELALSMLPADHPVYEDLQQIRLAADRSASMTRQLLAFARQQPNHPQVINPARCVGEVLKLMARLLGVGIKLEWLPPAECWNVNLDPGNFDQVLTNLVVNARDAMDGNGTLVIRLRNVSRTAPGPEGDYVELSVSDTGRGMDEQTRAHIFEPFFTTKELGKGTGLGLATVYGIVSQTGGFMEVDSTPGQGTVFRAYFPRHHGESSLPKVTTDEATSGGFQTILLVDDEPSVLDFSTRALRRAGFRVIPAASPAEALEHLDSHQPIHLLLTDVLMPVMNGAQLYAEVEKRQPGIPVVFASGYSPKELGISDDPAQRRYFLQKPFTLAQLNAIIARALGNS